MVENWVYGCLPAACLLLLLTPLPALLGPRWLTTLWLLIPAYMVHQAEEHDDNRFVRFVNQSVLGGREGLTQWASFVINVGLVWCGFALSLWLALAVRPGLGLIAVYTLLLNAAVHVLAAGLRRMYNPGLISAMVLFPVVGGLAMVELVRAGANVTDHALGLGLAALGHVGILATVAIRLWDGKL